MQAATNTVILHPVDSQNFFTIIGKYENIKHAEGTIDNMLQRSEEEHYKTLPKSTSNNKDNTYTDKRNENYPNRYKSQRIECRYHQRGYCRFGKNCALYTQKWEPVIICKEEDIITYKEHMIEK